MQIQGEVHFAYCFGGRERAQRVLDRFVRTPVDPAIAVDRGPLGPSHGALPDGYAHDVLKLRRELGLR
ncbi:hypothetical protein [Massilia sp. ST3]|uniref:hypothetical protein n=1 Tax=Massilia sp. ST3 TaxID=2824903 RepID=UPI001B80FCB9|nr:hypothetical protein [Massilia sp. ST3]MBQ5947757.1 hypothetical protein [Massilia sp. ST3]